MKEKLFKKGKTKRLFSVILALAMVISLLPMNSMKVYAADEPILADTITASGDYAKVKTFYGSVYYLTAFVTTVDGSWSLNGTNRDYIRVFNKEGAPKISKLVFHLSQDRYSSDYYTNSGSISFNGTREIIVSNISNTVSFVEIYNRRDYTSEFAESVDIYYTPHTCSESEVTESNKKAEQAATCTENGWSEYWICSCGKVYAPEDFSKSYDNENAWKTGDGKIAALGHDWEYTADGATITASCNRKATCGQADITLILIADDADYSGNRYSGAKIVDGDGIEIRSDNVNKWKSAGLAIPNITLYMSNSEGSTEGTADVSGLDKHGEGYYYAAVTVGTGDNAKTAKAAFTIGEGNPWPTVTDQNKINLFFASVVGSYKDESEPDNYWITISGDATSGFDITYCGDRMESIVLQQKDNNYYFGNADAGFTFTLDENGKLQNCYEADILNHMVAKHKGFPYDHYHGWSYSADGAVLTATCLTPSCGETATVTLSASSPSYSGIDGLDDFIAATGLEVSESDVEIYQVDAEGVTTGGTLLTSTPTDDGFYYASLTVEGKTAVKAFKIGNPVVHVTGVSLNKSATTLNVGATETLVATVTPDNATTKSVTWSSSDESVATVDSNGKVTAVAAGTATITVKTTDNNKTATCVVTVEADNNTGVIVPVVDNPAVSVDDNVVDELKNKIAITAEEQEKIDAGQKLNISLEIVNNENITTESKTAIENKMIEALGADAKVGKFIDISLFKWFEGDNKEEGRLTNLGNKEIEIKMTVPDEIYAANRDYKVARNHSGQVDILGTYDKATKTITVKTGLFSDYAIVYTEDEDPTNEDPENEEFEYDYNANSIKLSSKIKMVAAKNVTIEWTAVDGADAYEIYMNYCGKTNKCRFVKTVKAGTTKATITKLNKKAINQKKSVKAYVVAIKNIDGKKVRIGKSIGLHAVGSKSTKYTDAKKVTVDKTSVSLKKGKTSAIKATTVKVSPKKKILHSADEFRYASSNTKVAKVDKNGKIKGISKGSCYIYVYALNGCSKKIKVTVK